MLKNNYGAVLATLLVSLGIIGLIATISIPFFRQFQPNLALSAVMRDLASDLRFAQQQTITEQAVYFVELDEPGDIYYIKKYDGATTTVKSVDFPAEVSYQSVNGFTNNHVIFNYYGAVIESGTIVLINTNNNTKTITVKPSGYIQSE